MASMSIKTCSVEVNLFNKRWPGEVSLNPNRDRIIPIDPVDNAEIRKSRGSNGVFQMGTYLTDFRRIPV
jgi:hypothetical protein